MTLEAIVEAFSEALRRGTTPSIPDLIKQYPEHASSLACILPTLLTLEDFAHDTTGIPEEVELPLPMMLGSEFRLERKIGYGGMGTVFEAVQIPLDRRCAVKVLARHLAANPKHREAFIQEARLIGNLHHPHIVKVISAGETPEYAYYAMELIQGGTSLERLVPTTARELIAFALQAAQALAYIHHCQLTHCDIKPSNLLVNAGNHLLISDFGLARTPEQTAQAAGQSHGGTRAYTAPEQQTSPAADQYAFGITFRECFEQFGDCPPDMAAVLRVCTQTDPARRYPSMDAVAEDLRHILAGEPVSVRPSPLLRRLWLWSKRKPLAASLAATLLCGAILCVTLLTLSHNRTLKALATAEANLTVADTALACTFEYVGQDDPSRRGAVLLDALIPYYRDVIERRDQTRERIATAEGVIGFVALHTGDYATAVAAFRRQFAAHPTLQTQNRLVEALRLAGEPEEANALALAITPYLSAPDAESRTEAVRACTLLAPEAAAPLLARALEVAQTLLEQQPENADLRHLYYTLLEQAPTDIPADLNLDAARLQLATEAQHHPAYSIAALNRMTDRLNQTVAPLTTEDEQRLTTARQIAKQLLGRWQDDPQVLLATVRFSVADSSHLHRSPRQNQQARMQSERLAGALEVLFFGSSLPDDTKNPLFESLFSKLLEARRTQLRESTEGFRSRMRSKTPFNQMRRGLQPPWRNGPPKTPTP